jgi:phosphopantothenoylcysteine decarboxylase
MNILLGVTGSAAASLTPKLIKSLSKLAVVQAIMTNSAYHFVDDCIDLGMFNYLTMWNDKDEWPNKLWKKGDDILHIKLRDWADVLVIAPLTANTLAKIANGISDNLLTTVFAAWDCNKPIICAPAMNTKMWENPTTQINVSILRNTYLNLNFANPTKKKLACGEEGIGAMADISTIVKIVKQIAKTQKE